MRAWIATRKGLFQLHRQQNGWEIERSDFLGEPVTQFLHDTRDGTLYASLTLGHYGPKLHRKDPGAEAWQEIKIPEYPPQPEGNTDEFAWKLLSIWSLAAGGADEPGVLWAGTLPGGLFRSTDRGESWSLVEALWNVPSRREWFGGGNDAPGIHSILVDPRDSRHVIVAISCGGVWRTRDAGATWASATAGMAASYMPPERAEEPGIQDPHRIARCMAAPDTMWCQHHDGVCMSNDGAGKWQRIDTKTESNFGFAVAIHPRNAHTAWLVPLTKDEKRYPVNGALAVTRTRDGGKSFEVLRDGLPQRHCYDLIYRHGLAVDDSGEFLLIGSTTGGLWASDSGGDAWQALPARLPPIYAVSF